jgi:membrane protein required for colicin V production
LVLVIRGLIRGSVRQLFGLLGLVGGLWLAMQVSRWVGAQWLSARPAVVYWVLRWLVVVLAGLAVVSVFHWWGSVLGKAVQAGPAGWLDRVFGMVLGALIGMMWAIALVTFALFAPRLTGVRAAVTQALTAHALVSTGARACDAVEPRVPMLHGLGRLLHEAERRARAHSRGS